MPPSARTYMGIILIFFGRSMLFGARGQHAVDFPLMKQQAPQTHTNENSLSGLQIIHILIPPLSRDKRP